MKPFSIDKKAVLTHAVTCMSGAQRSKGGPEGLYGHTIPKIAKSIGRELTGSRPWGWERRVTVHGMEWAWSSSSGCWEALGMD